MTGEGVEVATEQVVRAWRRSESRDLWLEYTPAKGGLVEAGSAGVLKPQRRAGLPSSEVANTIPWTS